MYSAIQKFGVSTFFFFNLFIYFKKLILLFRRDELND